MTLRSDEDIVLAKVATVRRCVTVIRKLWFDDDPPVPAWVRLDLTVLNLQRAVEACLDMANHLIALNSWGLPGSAVEAIQLLADKHVVPAADIQAYRGMIGFWNIAVHNYREVDESIVRGIVQEHLDDLERFAASVLQATTRHG